MKFRKTETNFGGGKCKSWAQRRQSFSSEFFGEICGRVRVGSTIGSLHFRISIRSDGYEMRELVRPFKLLYPEEISSRAELPWVVTLITRAAPTHTISTTLRVRTLAAVASLQEGRCGLRRFWCQEFLDCNVRRPPLRSWCEKNGRVSAVAAGIACRRGTFTRETFELD